MAPRTPDILDCASAQWIGKRREQEDVVKSLPAAGGMLGIVCDGMGGYKGGRVASTTAVEAIKKHFETVKPASDMRIELFNSLKAADREISLKAQGDIELSKMGSTAVVAIIRDNDISGLSDLPEWRKRKYTRKEK